jgi:hypothetical protein
MNDEGIPTTITEALERSERLVRPFRDRIEYLERRLEVAERLASFAASSHSTCANASCPMFRDIHAWEQFKEERE